MRSFLLLGTILAADAQVMHFDVDAKEMVVQRRHEYGHGHVKRGDQPWNEVGSGETLHNYPGKVPPPQGGWPVEQVQGCPESPYMLEVRTCNTTDAPQCLRPDGGCVNKPTDALFVIDAIYRNGKGYCDTDAQQCSCTLDLENEAQLKEYCVEYFGKIRPELRVVDACKNLKGGAHCDAVCNVEGDRECLKDVSAPCVTIKGLANGGHPEPGCPYLRKGQEPPN